MKDIRNLLQKLRRVVAATMAAGLFVLLFAASASASNKHLVYVFVDGQTHTLSVDPTSVESVIKDLEIDLGNKDLVEPALDSTVGESPFNINVYRAQPAVVIDGDSRTVVSTPHSSGKDIVIDAGLQINPKDTFNVERVEDFLEENIVGLKVTINRSTKFNVNLFGETKSYFTHQTTVQDALKDVGIDAATADLIEPSLNSELNAGSVVNLYKEGVSEVVEEESINFTERTVNDDTINSGERVVETPGQDGLKEVTYEVFLRNGEEISRTILSSNVVKEPIEQVVKVGTKGEVLASESVVGTGDCSMVYQFSWPSDIAYGICMAESRGNPNAANFNDHHGSCVGSYSLMQVACFWYPFFGYSTADFYNSSINMQIAFNIWQRQGGFNAWTTYTSGLYLNYL